MIYASTSYTNFQHQDTCLPGVERKGREGRRGEEEPTKKMTPRGHSPSAERWHAVGVKRTTAALKVLEKETQRRLRELLDLRRSGQGADEAGGRPAHRRPRRTRPRGASGIDAPGEVATGHPPPDDGDCRCLCCKASCRCPCECACCTRRKTCTQQLQAGDPLLATPAPREGKPVSSFGPAPGPGRALDACGNSRQLQPGDGGPDPAEPCAPLGVDPQEAARRRFLDKLHKYAAKPASPPGGGARGVRPRRRRRAPATSVGVLIRRDPSVLPSVAVGKKCVAFPYGPTPPTALPGGGQLGPELPDAAAGCCTGDMLGIAAAPQRPALRASIPRRVGMACPSLPIFPQHWNWASASSERSYLDHLTSIRGEPFNKHGCMDSMDAVLTAL
ncbi:hypothetical protein DIPPA_17818 [Diplonema papillatum]|nr:hypothetical protein DIPPA_17818 [Diplonema papillatum]